MKEWKIPISKCPKISVWIFTITVILTYVLSVSYGHTPFITTFSQTGNFAPESYIFTFGLNISAFFLLITFFFYYYLFVNTYNAYENGELISILTDITFGFGFIAIIGYFGLSIISYQTDKVLHGAFTIIMFIGNVLHSIFICILETKLKVGKNHNLKIILSFSSSLLLILLFLHHYYEKFMFGFWLETSRVILECLAIYSLFFFLLTYEYDMGDLELTLIDKQNKN